MMIANLKPYSAMKDSGVEWLGEVPEHWDLGRGKSVFHCIDVRSQTGQEELLTVSSARGVVPRRSTSVTMFKAKSYVGHKLCWPGDLVINSLWAWARGLGVSSHHGIVSTAYGVYRAKIDLNPRFIHELVRSTPFHWELRVRSKGVWISRLQLTDDSFLGSPILLPPLPEQDAIVQFIEYVDRRIRRYIRAKQKLIKLLEEQKQALIHRAVTRGLDPDVPLKDSGVEWLGEVPENWEVRRVKQCACTISKGTTPSTEGREILHAGTVRFLKAENITNHGVQDAPLYYIDEDTDRVLSRSRLCLGDVLFVIAGATLGKTSIVSKGILPANTNQAVAFIRPNSIVDPRFLEFWLQSPRIKEQIWLNAVQAAQPNLSMANLGEFACPLPSRSEQDTIVRHLEDVMASTDATITRANREIELLNEYRTRLIADVVTGKLDVREAAASLPDEPDESDETDASEELLIDEPGPESDEEVAEAEHDE